MAMSSEMKISIVCNAIASGLGWAGFAIGLSAVTTRFWIRLNENLIRIGLWLECDTNDECRGIETGK